MIGSWAGAGVQSFLVDKTIFYVSPIWMESMRQSLHLSLKVAESGVSEMSERQRMSELFIEISLSPSGPSGGSLSSRKISSCDPIK